MKYANFVQDEYVDQNVLGAAVGLASGSVAGLGMVALLPGLSHPEVVTQAVSGLVLTSTLPAPFAIVFATGDHAGAHGTQTNADTQTYATNFSGVVPSSGSQTVYLLASQSVIQQNAYQVVGPPEGHPDYSPAFVPYTAYATNVETLALQASVTAANNSTTFELCRFTLAAGASALGTPNTAFQLRTTTMTPDQIITVSGSTVLTAAQANQVYWAQTSGLSITLPLASGSIGSWFGIVGPATVQVAGGTDEILGTPGTPTAGVTTFAMPNYGSCVYTAMAAVSGNPLWLITSSNIFGLSASGAAYIANAISGFVQFTNGGGVAPVLNAQGVAGVTLNIPPTGNIPTVQVSGGVPSANPGLTGCLYIN